MHDGTFMHSLNNKHIVLGISGGIAAYKSTELVRQLQAVGAIVRVVMTKMAEEFITPLTLQALSGYPVVTDNAAKQSDFAMDHIALARWADGIVIAPATANIIAKLAHGIADDVLSTLCLASESPLVLAPAMNQVMWQHAATQANVQLLIPRGVTLLGPASGEQACGDIGLGRMQEPAQLVNELAQLWQKIDDLAGLRILVTAGPTQEPIDPVRYITNRSSGKMGYALANAAAARGAKVTLISGPVHLDCPQNVERITVKTAQEMLDVTLQQVAQQDIFIATAAVADYRCQTIATQKLKKNTSAFTLALERNVDTLSAVMQLDNPPFTVGFAAETENLRENAKLKLVAKRLHMLAANDVSSSTSGFDADENSLLVLWPGGEELLPMQTKTQLAEELLTLINAHYREYVRGRRYFGMDAKLQSEPRP